MAGEGNNNDNKGKKKMVFPSETVKKVSEMLKEKLCAALSEIKSQSQGSQQSNVKSQQDGCLDDNKNLILAILECMNLGKITEMAQYQEILEQNLTYLTTFVDAQLTQGSTTTSQVMPCFVQQENQMQQTQGSTLKLQQESDPIPKLQPFLHLQPQ